MSTESDRRVWRVTNGGELAWLGEHRLVRNGAVMDAADNLSALLDLAVRRLNELEAGPPPVMHPSWQPQSEDT